MDEQLAGFMELYGQLFVEKLRQSLQMNYPYRGGSAPKVTNKPPLGFTQRLIDSIESKYDVNNEELVILMNSYWRYVNDGRKPGKYVPIKPLQVWAMDRLGLDSKEAKKAAFGISTNIKKFGIEPTYFYDNAITLLEQQLDGELYEQIGLSVEDFLAQVVEEGVGFNPAVAKEQTIQLNL